MIRKTSGYWMINGDPISLTEGVCDHPDDATVVEYSSEEELMEAHKLANPDLYVEETEEEPLE